MKKIVEILFGCRHDFGWPRKRGKRHVQTCVHCGAQREYTGALAA